MYIRVVFPRIEYRHIYLQTKPRSLHSRTAPVIWHLLFPGWNCAFSAESNAHPEHIDSTCLDRLIRGVIMAITTDQKTFKIFVTNRVAQIYLLVLNCIWSHVSTTENPADPSSRGLLSKALTYFSLHLGWTIISSIFPMLNLLVLRSTLFRNAHWLMVFFFNFLLLIG